MGDAWDDCKDRMMHMINGKISDKPDRGYIKKLLFIAVPMMVQNGISNFVNLLDNLMIGRVGTNALSGVAIANQIIFVFFLMVFGATAGVGIFTAQYFGSGDTEGIRYTFRFKILVNTVIAMLVTAGLFFFGKDLIGLFLLGEGDPKDAAQSLRIGTSYIRIMLISLIPVGLTQAYSGTLRDMGRTKMPMIASVCAILVNLVGNYALIYGHFGMPEMGAEGAAIATVASRFVELSILSVYTGTHSATYPFIRGAFADFAVPKDLALTYLGKSLPLMANETFWSLGITTMNQCYSYRSLDAVAAMNIQTTIYNLMGVAFVAMGEAVGIVMGHILGSGMLKEAPVIAKKMRRFTVLCGLIFGGLTILISPYFPLLYNTSDEVRTMAASFIVICGLIMPFAAFNHASYFIIRAGGNAAITVIFDCGYTWLIAVPVAFFLSRFTDMNVVRMFAVVQAMEGIKCVVAYAMVKSGLWIKNMSRTPAS